MRVRATFVCLGLAASAGCSGGSGSSTPDAGRSTLSRPLPAVNSPIIITNMYLDNFSSADLNYLQPTLILGEVPLTLTTTASEAKYTGTFTVTADPGANSHCSNAAAVYSVTTTDHLTFSIASAGPGICKVDIADHAGHSGYFWVSVTTATGTGS